MATAAAIFACEKVGGILRKGVVAHRRDILRQGFTPPGCRILRLTQGCFQWYARFGACGAIA